MSDCDLQDMSVAPLLSALHLHKTVAVLDLSHNMLGNDHLFLVAPFICDLVTYN